MARTSLILFPTGVHGILGQSQSRRHIAVLGALMRLNAKASQWLALCDPLPNSPRVRPPPACQNLNPHLGGPKVPLGICGGSLGFPGESQGIRRGLLGDPCGSPGHPGRSSGDLGSSRGSWRVPRGSLGDPGDPVGSPGDRGGYPCDPG